MENDHARTLLTRERERVERALAGFEPSPDDEVGDAEPSEVDAETDAAVVEALREELAAIERAEQRLAEGTYGRSVESGDPIPDARLEAVPWAERTIAEQSRYEHSG